MASPVTEQQLQAQCVKWFWNEFPSERRMLHANNNNSANQIAGNIARSIGVVKGVSDLEYITWGGKTWYIEMKLPGRILLPEQEEFRDMVLARGHIYIIIYSFEEFKNLLWNLTGKS